MAERSRWEGDCMQLRMERELERKSRKIQVPSQWSDRMGEVPMATLLAVAVADTLMQMDRMLE